MAALSSGPMGLTGTITLQRAAGRVVLCLCGEVDAGVVSNFERDYGPEPVAIDVIDAGAVTFIGSVGVAFLVRWVRAARNAGATAVLHQSSPALDRILELTKLNDIIGRPAGGG